MSTMEMNVARWAVPGLALLAACADGGSPVQPNDPAPVTVVDGIRYTAELLIMESYPVQLEAVVSAASAGSGTAEVTFPDGCVALLRVYRDAQRSGEPVWDQSRTVGCYQALVEWTLEPGGVRSAKTPRVSAADILGDSLPDGRYYLSVLLRPGGTPTEIPFDGTALSVPR